MSRSTSFSLRRSFYRLPKEEIDRICDKALSRKRYLDAFVYSLACVLPASFILARPLFPLGAFPGGAIWLGGMFCITALCFLVIRRYAACSVRYHWARCYRCYASEQRQAPSDRI